MGRGRLLIILILLITSTAKSQQSVDFRQVDSSMYAHTLAGNWDEVIRIGKTSLQNEIDYFYLRLRMGIAYFNINNYSPDLKK